MAAEIKAMQDALEAFKIKKTEFVMQKEQTQATFHQLSGAVIVLERLIAEHQEKIEKELKKASGEENGEVECENKE
jgi:hypothetical protein